MTEWRIYRKGGLIRGEGQEHWPAGLRGVQVVVLMEPPGKVRWHYSGGPVRDRQLWTGEDEYDPFGWGTVYGAWMSDAEYFAVWERACGDN